MRRWLPMMFGVLSLAQMWQDEWLAAIYFLGWMAFTTWMWETRR